MVAVFKDAIFVIWLRKQTYDDKKRKPRKANPLTKGICKYTMERFEATHYLYIELNKRSRLSHVDFSTNLSIHFVFSRSPSATQQSNEKSFYLLKNIVGTFSINHSHKEQTKIIFKLFSYVYSRHVIHTIY